jgi:hypothetical protein
MATYTTKVFKDGNWVAPASQEAVNLTAQIPANAAYVATDIVRLHKLRPDLDGLGQTVQINVPASGGLVTRSLTLQQLNAGNALLKQISPYRTIVGLNDKNEASYFADASGAGTVMYAFFDKNDVCLATNASAASPPAGTVKTVRWPPLPYLAAVLAAADGAGAIAVASAQAGTMATATLVRKNITKEDGSNIQRYYGYSDAQKIVGTASNP